MAVKKEQGYLVTFGFDQALRAMKVGFLVKRIEGDSFVYWYHRGCIWCMPTPFVHNGQKRTVTSFGERDILAYDWVIVAETNDGEVIEVTGTRIIEGDKEAGES